jgi:hypothetical protein
MPICTKGVEFLTPKITNANVDARKGPSEKTRQRAISGRVLPWVLKILWASALVHPLG